MAGQRKADRRTRREEDLETQIVQLEAVIGRAIQAGQFSAAINGRGKVAMLRSDLHHVRAAAVIAELTDELEVVRAQRLLAIQDGSWVAAKEFTSQERQIVDARRAAAEALDADASVRGDADAMLDQLEMELRALPESTQHELIHRLQVAPLQ